MRGVDGVVGLDLSLTSTGFARVVPGHEDIHTKAIQTAVKDGDRLDRYTYIATDVLAMMSPDDLVLIEDFAYGVVSKKSQLATLGELNGVVKLMVWRYTKRKPLSVAPGQWKKFLCDNGRLQKDEFKMQALKKYGLELRTNDECAALVLARLGMCLHPGIEWPEGSLLVYERKIVEDVRTKNAEILQALANIS